VGRTSHRHGFLYTGGTYITLDDPSATNGTNALGINNAGSYNQGSGVHGFLFTISPNPPAPAGTSADMILRHGADGQYEIYDIGGNSLLAAYSLGQVGTDWKFVALGGFFGSDTTDMLLRNANTGGFEVYDITNDITGAGFLGNVGLDWQVMGFGNFSSRGENDMILRNSGNGGIEVYDIRNNQITGAAFLGAVGLSWQFSGVGNFSGRGTSDMMLRDSNTGGLEVYNINNNQLTGAAMSAWIGSSRASAISAASPAKPICCCAAARLAGWKCTTSTTTGSPARPSWARSAWIGSSRASRRSMHPAHPTSAEHQHRRVPGLQHRQQSAHGVGEPGRRRTGLAARRLRCRSAEFAGRIRRRLERSARAGDGRFRRRKRRDRRIECRPHQRRYIAADIVDDAAARVRAARR
jgi:hypothetical protein